ncbi:MAG: hypothetical protein M3Q51_03045 [Pseudomonadota bacterium]|nr:hypothetical protein [Pseudomonadota bacterium]MDQ3159981.1 hypothetical protein [Pseudomonadota bacterium]
MFTIKTQCDASTKAAFQALAEREDATEAQLLRRLIEQALVAGTDWRASRPPRNLQVSSKLDVRLAREQVEAVRKVAAGEGVSAPWWIRKLVRRRLDRDVIPFNPQELQVLNQLIAQVGSLGRNVNTLARRCHAGEPVALGEIDIAALTAVIQQVRQQVGDLADRAKNRYEAD